MGITAGSRAVPGRNACDRRHLYRIIIIIIIIIIIVTTTQSKVGTYALVGTAAFTFDNVICNNIAAYHIKVPFKNFGQSMISMFSGNDFVLLLGGAMCGSGCVENYSQNWELECFMLTFERIIC